MGNPILGADSMLDDSTAVITPSVASDTAFPTVNVFNDRLWSPMKMGSSATVYTLEVDAGIGNLRTVDYFMMVGHDLFDPAQDGNGPIETLQFQESADAAAWSDVFVINGGSTPTPNIASNKIIARKFAAVTNRAFRIRLTRSAAFIVSIGELQFGQAVVIPTGVPVGYDPNAENSVVRRTQSQTGQILGTVEIFAMREGDINIQLLETSFVDGTDVGEFKHFWDTHASKMKPFLWHWNPDTDEEANPGQFEEDAFFGVLESNARINRPLRTQVAAGLRDISFSIVGVKE